MYPLDAEQALFWDETWQELSLSPVVIRGSTPDQLGAIPGINDSLTRILTTIHSHSAVPYSLQPYLRIHPVSELSLYSRCVLNNPWRNEEEGNGAYRTRIHATDGQNWSGGLLLDRDAEEPSKTDFITGTLAWKSNDECHTIVAGASKVTIGSGLMCGKSRFFLAGPGAFRFSGTRVAPSLSSTESGGLLGVSGRTARGNWEAVWVLTRPVWDARIDTTDEYPAGAATRLYTDGTHVTDPELMRKGALRETYALARVGRTGNGVSVGVSTSYSRFPRLTAFTNGSAQQNQSALGVDTKWERNNTKLQADGVYDINGPWGVMTALRQQFSAVRVSAAFWHYSEHLFLPHSAGPSFRDTSSDETAGTLEVRFHVLRNVHVSLYTSRYRQKHGSVSNPWPKEGRRDEISCEMPFGTDYTVQALVRRTGTSYDDVDSPARTTGRIIVTRSIPSGTVTLHGESVHADGSTSWLVAPSATLRLSEWLRVRARAAVFDIDYYRAAIYLYEYRAQGYGICRMMTGTGVDGNLALDIGNSDIRFTLFCRSVFRKGQSSSTTIVAQTNLLFR